MKTTIKQIRYLIISTPGYQHLAYAYRASAYSFVDGHAEIHKWRTQPSAWVSGIDFKWHQERTGYTLINP